VDPSDAGSIRQGILRVIGEPAYREGLVRKGFENIKRFSAKEIGRLYLEMYQEVALSRRGFVGSNRATVVADTVVNDTGTRK
jgi:hypothetical protein